MNKRQELLADYLQELVADKGEEVFYARDNYVQILVCMYVVEDLYEMMGKKPKPLRRMR